jgi:hypothetical protein
LDKDSAVTHKAFVSISVTVIANSGHLNSQRRQAMHNSGADTIGSSSVPAVYTFLGQNSVHMPQFLHHFLCIEISLVFLFLGVLVL